MGDILIAGDTLFQQSIGRTDFTGGDFATLINSITEKLMILDDSVRVLPGHGDTTTIGFERNNNPFLE
jgi:glyoxylase-like metal-dependent hydrolase (beta-lactamase superfamily II)